MNALNILKHKQSGNVENLNGLTTFINPYSYLFFRKNLELFDQFDYLLIDGITLVKLLSMVRINTSRYSFDMTSLAPIVFKKAIATSQSIYFIGSEQDSIISFVEVIKSNFKELNIKGYRHGFFDEFNERDDVLNNIITINPDIVVVGMGTPLQELFLIDLRKKGWMGTGFTCGGFIHQTVGSPDYYPRVFNKYNLRWLYRMIDEPKLIKRYLFLYPKSVTLFFLDYIRSRIQ